MRGTIHLVTARDAAALRPIVQPAIERVFAGWRKFVNGLDVDAVAKAGRRIAAEEPPTWAELGRRLSATWPDRDPQGLARVVQAKVPLAQVPPRGVWGRSGAARHAPLDAVIGTVKAAPLDLPTLVLRYLKRFGPASVQDAQAWSGLTKLAGVFESLEAKLVRFRSPRGVPLYDVRQGPRPDPDVPAPPRFLPVYENLVLGFRDRERLVRPDVRLPEIPMNANVRYVLVDGTLGATWRLAREPKAATLTVEPFVRLSRDDTAAIKAEARRFVEFQAPNARSTRVHVR